MFPLGRLLTAFSLSMTVLTGAATFDADIQPFLEANCVRCHGPEKQKGKLRLDTLSADFGKRDTAATWLEVRDQINLGEMPPEDEPRPDVAQLATVSKWIAANLREAERAALRTGGRVLLRRMNRHEYTHTIADLLHMKFPPGESPLDVLPPDGTAEGFDKVSAALLLDPSLMQLYYEVARQIADRAIVDGPPPFPTETWRMEFEDIAENRAIRYLVTRLGLQPVPGGLRMIDGSTRSYGTLKYPDSNKTIATSGFYRFTVRAGAHRGEDDSIPRMRVTQSHPDAEQELIMEVDVLAPWDEPQEYTVILPRDNQGGEVQVSLVNGTELNMSQRPGESFMRRNGELGKEGDFAGTIRLDGRKIAEGWGGERSTPDPDKLDISRYHQLFLDYVEIEGPLYDQWPPASHTTVLFKGDTAEDERAYAREIFTHFLPRAWRRPIAASEVEPIVGVVQTELENGQDFLSAIRVGLAAALTSPKFLYLAEPAPAGEQRPLDGYELASRLSYFLWSSMPDERLFELAASGALTNPVPATLEAEVDRILADPKAERFVDGFAAQWLHTGTFLAFEPGERTYRDYDKSLGEAAVNEPLEFFRHLLREKRSALNFLDSDFAVVNSRLARHYGIPGVEGDQFRPVPLPPASHRGGLLGMMGVHLAGSDGVRTKPVSRAVYVREVLFNDPPDPPPPNAGEIEPNIKGERLTVRERLLQHQQIESCASCHRSLDPYGLALENFNVIGAWRDRQDGEDFRGSRTPPIDPGGKLPNGEPFASFDEFRSLLVDQADRFRRGLAEKMLVYALGRPVEPTDDTTLNNAVEAMKAEGDTFHALIKSLVASPQFLHKLIQPMNIKTRSPLSRRTFLRGTGACLSLPFLEAMMSNGVRAASTPEVIPRMGAFYFGTGMNMRQFYPEGFGPGAKLSRILQPLETHRDDFTVFSGTWLEKGGGHDGAYPFSTSIESGAKQTISPDQLAAELHGKHTRFPSLQLSVKRGTGFGSQALATISWNRQGVPLAAENDPKTVFNKLFRATDKSRKQEQGEEFRQRGSVLDAVLGDAKQLEGKLGKADREQLDQYFNSIREVERGLEREIAWADRPKPQPDLSGYRDYEEAVSPEGNGNFVYDDYAKLVYDLIALAFQTDSTRVISYVVRTELAGGVYPEFGVSKGYHELTHHGNDPKNLEDLAKVDTIYMRHWNYFLDRLTSIKEGDGTLLDHTMLGFSSGMGIGHSKTQLPTVLSGGRALGIKHKTHAELAENTPLSSLWQTMIEKMGVEVDGPFQDSRGTINEVLA